MPSNRTATKARAISRNRSIIGCPLTGNSLRRRLTGDGVDNKANGRFCRLAGMGMAQPWRYSLSQSGVPSGAIRRAVSMFTSRRMLARPPWVRGPWQIDKRFAEFAGRLYEQPGVWVHVAEARSFVAGSRDRYDLIQLPLLDSFATAAAGTHSLSESYIYTIEAFEQYLDHLRPGGYLAITRWLKLPPRDSLRLFATAVSALEHRGIGEPGRHLALVRSWNTTTLLVKNGPVTGEDAAAIRRFAEERAFDLSFLRGVSREEA